METASDEIVEKILLRKDEYGVYRVGGTRVMLDSVLRDYKRGVTPRTWNVEIAKNRNSWQPIPSAVPRV